MAAIMGQNMRQFYDKALTIRVAAAQRALAKAAHEVRIAAQLAGADDRLCGIAEGIHATV